MKTRGYLFVIVMIASGFLLTSCLLPGMIPLTGSESTTSMPTMEKDAQKVIEVLKSNNYVRLETLAQEQYTEQDFSKPGTLTFTVKLTEEMPVYFSYGWCSTTEEILKQNFEHIKVGLYFNDKMLGSDVVHPLTFTRPDALVCLDFGVLMSNWPAGNYMLEAAAKFNEKINDGISDYQAGDYVFDYSVTVEKNQKTPPTPSPSP